MTKPANIQHFARPKKYSVPQDIISRHCTHPLLADFIITEAGYSPKNQERIVVRESSEEYLVVHCLDGSGWFQANGTQWNISKGQIGFVLPDSKNYSYSTDSNRPWVVQWAKFQGQHTASLLDLAYVSVENPVVSLVERLNVTILFQNILSTFQLGYELRYIITTSAYLRQILSNIALLTTRSPVVESSDFDIEQSIKYMHQNITTACTLNDFAKQACLSSSHFSHRFRKTTGYAPIDYFIRLKIERACELLETTDLQISNISTHLGYQDQFYFSRIFKKIMGVSPQQYRNQVIGQTVSAL